MKGEFEYAHESFEGVGDAFTSSLGFGTQQRQFTMI